MALTAQQIIALRDPDTANQAAFQGAVDGLVDLADAQTHSSAFGDLRNLAIALLVLHWEYMRRRGGASTQSIGVGDGPSRREFARPNKGDLDSGELTSWGLELQQLSRRHIMGAMNRFTL